MWRGVALSIVPLWSNLQLSDAPLGMNQSLPKQLPALNLTTTVLEGWLERSGTNPLTLDCQLSTPSRALGEIRQRCLRILFTESTRWKDVQISLNVYLIQDISHLPNDAFPILKRFHLHHPPLIRRSYDPIVTDILPLCPRLEDLHLSRVNVPDPGWGRLFPFPWSTLTSLSLSETHDTIYMNEFITSLASASNLRSLSLCFPTLRGIMFRGAIAPLCRLLQLRELRLSSTEDIFFSDIFNKIETPSLTSLTIDTDNSGGPKSTEGGLLWDDIRHESFLEFIAPSSSTLEHLKFNVQTYLPDIDAFLAQLPNLRSLAWMAPEEFSCRSLKLRFDANGRLISGACPRLEKLSFYQLAGFGKQQEQLWKWADFMEMVESRWKVPDGAVDGEGKPVVRLRVLGVREDLMKGLGKSKKAYRKRIMEGMVREGLDVVMVRFFFLYPRLYCR